MTEPTEPTLTLAEVEAVMTWLVPDGDGFVERTMRDHKRMARALLASQTALREIADAWAITAHERFLKAKARAALIPLGEARAEDDGDAN